MSNVFCAAWRNPCAGRHHLGLLSPVRSALRASSTSLYRIPAGKLFTTVSSSVPKPLSLPRLTATQPFTPPALVRCLHSRPTPPPPEHGVPVRPEPFSEAEIKAIFGARTKLTPQMGNRVLAVLQGRREAGTLDLDLPADITRSARPATLDKALTWLRNNHPMDEDAAILARVEREEREEEAKLIRRAEDLGLYKPQSGSYEAELGESQDPSGKSVLQEARKYNEKRLLAEQERKRQEWLEGEERQRQMYEQQVQKHTALQKSDGEPAYGVQQRADPTERPLLAWVQKHHLQAMDTTIDATKITTSRRIFPSLAVVLLTIGAGYVFAQTYEPPARADRMWPDTPPAAATVAAIIGINLGIWALWKVPPAWRLLNRYFISVAACPRPLSNVGAVFSHQSLKHLGMNMLVLYYSGTKLHDEIGRGNFLSLYMVAGVMGSFTSLAAHALTGQLAVTSLGASGAIAGLIAAFCVLNADQKLTIAFLPQEWQHTMSANGWVFLTGIVALEFLNLIPAFRFFRVDNYAHLGGYLTGTIFALAYKDQQRRKREEMPWFKRAFLE
ncbi:rhomboid-domain-containing protein [Aspergillus campestris IBT 28561]|uniref:Rhomboid-domain-containing protein n=1 Tax=Aspergillus campestris (strain IBT 28561) TaxID=1392248 RepID=A0A2I1CTI0_ASPC2|nr:rhomboid-domain-containing protein [Aspergillus campestris IBT 28561]PKY00919.1 rhomboid-domain-containing protein [Aspergillus campestris IBT 28561]